ncbi:MAG: tRNA (adenosine(37)-N6)-dimethylallyltransferase MiaA [Anaerolineae bacterium]|nr:tRNA (adenosine(37)-N6)-dimethylallyltransferase MiaA [Anaerolineae bacterium]
MGSDNSPKVLVILGPTAVGKTALALQLGAHLAAEVVSADSRQIYRYMDIGTAKPTPEERARLRHHLIDIVDPDQTLTLAQYQELANQAIQDIWSRGKLPMLVGGTGLYIRALLEGWTIPHVPPDESLRAELEREAERFGPQHLHERLAQVDPLAAKRIDPRNVRRVIRALEVYYHTGKPISQLQKKAPPPYHVYKLGLTLPRPELYKRIDARVDRMIAEGLVEEVRELVARGYGYELPSMSGLGYKQIGQYLRGEVSLEEAIALIKRHTRRFVRQQYNWFRLSDRSIHWLDAAQLDVSALLEAVLTFWEQDTKKEGLSS